MPGLRRALDARQRPQNQRAPNGPRQPSPITIGPVTGRPVTQNGEQPSQHRPARWQPALQHPAEGGTHHAHAEPCPPERVSGDDLAGGQDHALRGLRKTLVGGPLNDAEGFEMHPHGMGRISEVSLGIGVRGQQVAEFVMHSRLGDRKKRK